MLEAGRASKVMSVPQSAEMEKVGNVMVVVLEEELVEHPVKRMCCLVENKVSWRAGTYRA